MPSMMHRARVAVVVAVALVLVMVAVPAGSVEGEKDYYATMTLSSRELVPGQSLTVTGSCDWPHDYPADRVNVGAYLITGQAPVAYDFGYFEVGVKAGRYFRAVLEIPDDAISGRYRASIGCYFLDQGLGNARRAFTVSGGRDPASVPPTTPIPPCGPECDPVVDPDCDADTQECPTPPTAPATTSPITTAPIDGDYTRQPPPPTGPRAEPVTASARFTG